MDYTFLFLILIGCPFGAAILTAVLPSKSTPRAVYSGIHVLELAGVAVAGLALTVAAFMGDDIFVFGEWFHIDGLSALFLGLIAIIAPCTGIYSLPYIKHDVEDKKLEPSQVKQYYLFYSLFVFSMILAVSSNNIIMMWVSVEATTLSTVFLVGVYRTKLARSRLEIRHRVHGGCCFRYVRHVTSVCECGRCDGRRSSGSVLDGNSAQCTAHGSFAYDDRLRVCSYWFRYQGRSVSNAYVAS